MPSSRGRLFESFFVARITQPGDGSVQQNGSNGGGSGGQRSALFCRFTPPGGGGTAVPAADNLSAFCWPLGAGAVKPSPYLVTSEFLFTLTGGDGSRLHGMCRRTHDPTFHPPAAPQPGTHKASGGTAAHEQKRLPQVICILSQHCWQPFFSKVLEIADQLLAPHASCAELPPDAPAALFLATLQRLLVAAGPPLPPLGAVLRVPLPYSAAPISVDPMRRALVPPGRRAADMVLGMSTDAIELEVPPDMGSSPANAGISLARLLWFLTPRQAVTLVASLLLERRIILVARDAETVSAAVHAANALIYPFRWQHIYLPLLPLALKDYLAAPMPYLVGIQAECLPLLRGMALEETVMIDLDRLGSCTPELGSPGDDYFLLPFARELEDVFEVVREHIQSPTEFDSTPKCTELVQDFFLRLVGGYRKFVRPDEEVTPAALALGLDRPMPGMSSLTAANGGSSSVSNASRGSSKGACAMPEEENPRAHGFVFDQAAFILSHRRKDKITTFLQQFRNSQMLEVFITERLTLASEGYVTDDPFEQKVAERNTRLGLRLGIPGVGSVAVPGMGMAAAGKGRIGSLLRKAGSAVKQGSVGLAASIKQLGSNQQEAELQVAGRTHSGPNLGRMSPSAHGLGLARRSPAPAAASLVAHSRGNSFSGSSKLSSRSSSYTNLSRPSANLAALNGGVQPSLEQLRPDMFFGADDDDDDDTSSVASRISQEASGQGRASTGAAGPLAAALGARRSFGTLFYAPSSSPPPQQQSPSASPLGSRSASMQHVATRLATTESSEQQQQHQQHAADAAASFAGATAFASAAAAAAAVAAVGQPSSLHAGHRLAEQRLAPYATGSKYSAAAGGAAGAAGLASPATLYDLSSPAQHKSQQPLQPRPQQLFADWEGAGASQPPSRPASLPSRANSGGWATFDDAPAFNAGPFGSPQASANVGPAVAAMNSGYALESSMGPLGSGMSCAVLRQSSSSGRAAAAGLAAAAMAAVIAADNPFATSTGQEQQGQVRHEQQQQQRLASPLEQPTAWDYQRQWQQQSAPHQEQQQPSPSQQHQQHQQQQATALKQLPPAMLDGVSAGWTPYGQQLLAGSSTGRPPQAPAALPAVCRQSAHSPLAAGMPSVHRIASLSHLEARRGSSSSGDVGGGPGSGTASPPRHQQHAGGLFSDLAAAAASEASASLPPSRHHTSSSSSGGAPDFHSPLRLSSSSWSEAAWVEAPAAALHSGNPFQPHLQPAHPVNSQQLQPAPAQPLQQQQQQQQQQAVLTRQLTAGDRMSSFGEWAGAPPPNALASQLSSLRL